ncbi:hypothetical protein JTB14_021153 [Gonioctena quinquepunctata]|nr:hypothetical protein JTB14_021153 [Gonioctena quinquepunctata]
MTDSRYYALEKWPNLFWQRQGWLRTGLQELKPIHGSVDGKILKLVYTMKPPCENNTYRKHFHICSPFIRIDFHLGGFDSCNWALFDHGTAEILFTKWIYAETIERPNYSFRVKNRGGPAKIYTVNFHSLVELAGNKLHGDVPEVVTRERADCSQENYKIVKMERITGCFKLILWVNR